MPEGIKPPKTIPEMGIHLVYMSRAINAMQKTLEEMRDGSVTRADFEEHVTWGEAQIKLLATRINGIDTRVNTIEVDRKIDNSSVFKRIGNRALDIAITTVAIAIIVAILYVAVKTSSPGVIDAIQQ